jgi:predicted nucleic acid-binding protein
MGVLDAEAQQRGMPLNPADGMIGSTALEHGLTIVTRNVRDFSGVGAQIFNPRSAAS